MSVVVFTGPTIPAAEAAMLLPCIALPPARQGDIWRAVHAHRPVAIGLIDGVFLHEPAVWHREILWALTEGVHVLGAASMGALRATELEPFGMRGVGKVFAAYRDGVWPGFAEAFEDDDEVAVLHAPPELGSAPVSDAMVDLRETLLAAVDAHIVSAAQCHALTARLKELPFGERSFQRLSTLAEESLPPESAAHFAQWLPRGRIARKRIDAIALLDTLEDFLRAPPPPFAAPFRFEQAQVWETFIATADEAPTPDEALVLEEARLWPEDWHETAHAALGHLRAVAAAPAPSDQDVRAAFDRFRRAHGLSRRSDIDRWLVSNAATEARLERIVREKAAISSALASPPPGLRAAILDHLRLTGRFAELLRRAQAKRTALAGLPLPPPGPMLDAALDWYTERASAGPPSVPDGWAGETKFQAAVWREYVFMTRRHHEA
jgi:hypothetical protein